MSKTYLKNLDKCYCIGAYLRWNADDECFDLDQLEDTVYFDGEPVNFDEDEKPYISKD